MVFGGMVVHVAKGILYVYEHVWPFVTNAQYTKSKDIGRYRSDSIAQKVGVDAVRLQPLADERSLVFHIQPTVTAARTYDNGDAGIGSRISKIRSEPLATESGREKQEKPSKEKPAGRREE